MLHLENDKVLLTRFFSFFYLIYYTSIFIDMIKFANYNLNKDATVRNYESKN